MERKESSLHTFHIPVMGIGYTIDTPLRVARFGIDSVVSIMDDIFIEKMRSVVCKQFHKEFIPIETTDVACRSKRITAYLNLLNELVTEQFEKLKEMPFEKDSEVSKYFELLHDESPEKKLYLRMQNMTGPEEKHSLQQQLRNLLSPGVIDVNIMTKLDKTNYRNRKALPREFNDAHAALKGYALSDLESSIVFSAGLNPALIDYTSQFGDFFPDATGRIKKKIILKVSDLRSAFIQGKFFAKKGLWVSEYRIESGLNCGGHAFATDGLLLGPILEEFKLKRASLIAETYGLYTEALKSKQKFIPSHTLPVKFSAQGGVGTAAEQQFLRSYYELNTVGWGSPFLLVPEATNIDDGTRQLLQDAEEKDLYLSNISPLGVAYNNLRGNTKDLEKEERIKNHQPGSPCTQKYLVLDTTYTKEPVCTASRKYQDLAIKALDREKETLSKEAYGQRFRSIVDKACICVGLSTSALIANGLDTSLNGKGVSICPGPNLAYFSKKLSLREMIDHIYGRKNVIERSDRPHMFIKELDMYVDYLRHKINEWPVHSEKRNQYARLFVKNLQEGIRYYKLLLSSIKSFFGDHASEVSNDLKRYELELHKLVTSFNLNDNALVS